jgi:hypothetical protein
MIYFLALIPATALTVAGYFVLYLANRSEGTFRTFGKYLGFWAFTLAGLVILGAIFAAAHGCRHGQRMGGYPMHDRWHGNWPGDPHGMGPQGAGPESLGAPATQAPPGPPPPAPH